LPIVNCRFTIGLWRKSQLAIGNRKSKIRRPTRYRVVVLTSLQLTKARMAIRAIVEYPDPVLLSPGLPVESFNSELESLVADMFETMYDAGGVGLAAQQIGLSLRLFVMDCDGIKLVAANPEIIFVAGEQSGEEGCLSVAKVPAELKRPDRAILRAQDLTGKTFERAESGLAARCFLHETDHCDGRLFIYHLSPLRRDLVLRKFRKLKKTR
jgi:peptide deformylase